LYQAKHSYTFSHVLRSGVIGCPTRIVQMLIQHCIIHFGLVWLRVSHHLPASFHSFPLSRMDPSSRFLLPSRYRTTWCRYGARAHVLETKTFHSCMQPNTTSSHSGPTTNTTKHSYVHSLSLPPMILDCPLILNRHPKDNQSHPH